MWHALSLALGAKVEIETLPGYMPMVCDPVMTARFKAIAVRLVGEEHFRVQAHRTSSTDMGDLSQVMPVLHPYVGGSRGTAHGADYEIVDKALAYVTTAKALAAMVADLMGEGAAVAREIVAKARPPMTRRQYLAFQRSISRREVWEGG